MRLTKKQLEKFLWIWALLYPAALVGAIAPLVSLAASIEPGLDYFSSKLERDLIMSATAAFPFALIAASGSILIRSNRCSALTLKGLQVAWKITSVASAIFWAAYFVKIVAVAQAKPTVWEDDFFLLMLIVTSPSICLILPIAYVIVANPPPE